MHETKREALMRFHGLVNLQPLAFASGITYLLHWSYLGWEEGSSLANKMDKLNDWFRPLSLCSSTFPSSHLAFSSSSFLLFALSFSPDILDKSRLSLYQHRRNDRRARDNKRYWNFSREQMPEIRFPAGETFSAKSDMKRIRDPRWKFRI